MTQQARLRPPCRACAHQHLGGGNCFSDGCWCGRYVDPTVDPDDAAGSRRDRGRINRKESRMPRGNVKQQPQTHIMETNVDDPDLLAQLEIMAETRQAHRDHMAAKKAVDLAVEKMSGVDVGDTIRCGVFTIPIVERRGGGFDVPAWTKKLPGKIIDTSAPDAGDQEAGDDGDD